MFGRKGTRSAPTLVNRGYGAAFFWDGRVRTLEEQVLKPIQDPNEMDLTVEEASRRVKLLRPLHLTTEEKQALAAVLASLSGSLH